MIALSYVECEVPEEMTLAQWRHSRAAAPRRGRILERLRRTLLR